MTSIFQLYDTRALSYKPSSPPPGVPPGLAGPATRLLNQTSITSHHGYFDQTVAAAG